MKQCFITLIAILMLAGIAHAQQTREQSSKRYIATLGVLLDSESAANTLVKDLEAFSNETPYRYDTVLSTTQRLLATKATPQMRRTIPVLKIFGPCADAAASIDGSDDDFSEIVFILGAMRTSDSTNTFSDLARLDALGIPVWRFIATGIGRSEKVVKDLSFSGRLRPSGTAELLLVSFTQS